MGKSGKLRKRRRLMDGGGGDDVLLGPSSEGRRGNDDGKGRAAARFQRVGGGGAEDGDVEADDFVGDDDDMEGADGILLPKDDIRVAVRTLELLASRPDLARSPALKGVRVAVHALTSSDAQRNVGKTRSGRVSDALRDARWGDALQLLQEMRALKQVPKLGAVQRWVRDCDAAYDVGGAVGAAKAATAIATGESSAVTPGSVVAPDGLVIEVLDAILRTADPGQVPSDLASVSTVAVRAAGTSEAVVTVTAAGEEHAVASCRCPCRCGARGGANGAEAAQSAGLVGDAVVSRIRRKPDFRFTEEDPDEGVNVVDHVVSTMFPAPADAGVRQAYAAKFSVATRELAAKRRPANRHDLTLYASAPGTIELESRADLVNHGVRRIPVPCVPGAFALRNVFSPGELRQMLAATESVGYTPDEPQTGLQSVLAHAFHWLVDEPMLGEVFERCRQLLPQQLGGGALVGINARWRCYRYVPGAVYRPHIDGAWPGSAVSEDGKYHFDGFGDRWSRLTFLIYLNSGFSGGGTTFYTPAADVGYLEARAIEPLAGTVMVFPHGDTCGSLLHEGSAVLEGTKYIVRTDVLYMKK